MHGTLLVNISALHPPLTWLTNILVAKIVRTDSKRQRKTVLQFHHTIAWWCFYVHKHTSKHWITMLYNPCFDAPCKYCKLVSINVSTIASWCSPIASNCALWVLQKEYIGTLHINGKTSKSEYITVNHDAKRTYTDNATLNTVAECFAKLWNSAYCRSIKSKKLNNMLRNLKRNTPSHEYELKQNGSHYRAGISFLPSKRSKVPCDLLCLEDFLHQHFDELRSGGLVAALAKA